MEETIGSPIPILKVDMKFFATVDCISRSFWRDAKEGEYGLAVSTVGASANRAARWRESVDARVRSVALSFGAREAQFPALIATRVLERAEYLQAFPHLLMVAGRYQSPSVEESQTTSSETTEWCLSPAVCYHVYAHFRLHPSRADGPDCAGLVASTRARTNAWHPAGGVRDA